MRCTLLSRLSIHDPYIINIMHGRGLSNEMHCQLQPKGTLGVRLLLY